MAESRGQHEACNDSNPITETEVLLGEPKRSAHCSHGDAQPPLSGHKHSAMNGQLTSSNVGDDHSPLVGNHSDGPGDHSSSDSSSDDDSEEEGQESSSEDEGELSEEVQLKNAGVDIDLQALGTPTVGGMAPLNLLSEFVSCCVRDEYSAALILCKKVLEFEPENQTAKEFLPVLRERLKLDEELSTESSSDEERGSGTSSPEEEARDHTTTQSHDC